LLIVAFLFVQSAHAETVIERVDPPNWWTRHSMSTVRLMFTGRELTGRTLTTGSPHLQAGPVTVTGGGRYAFADIRVGPGARPGRYDLKVNRASIAFELLAPRDRTGRFQGFDQDDVIYLIMVDRFANGDTSNDEGVDRMNPRLYHGGDFAGIKQRLGYLKQLGITALWLTPIYRNGSRSSYHGYHATDMYAAEDRFGDASAFRELVEAAHGAGLKVIQDQVVNHVGPKHPWAFYSPTPTWLHGTTEKHLNASYELWALIDPNASSAIRRSILEGWFANMLPDLNQNDPEVSRYLIQNALWWIGMTGVDGIRQDTVPYVPAAFWPIWNQAIQREYPRLSVVGEVFNADPRLLFHFDKLGFQSLFDFPLYFATREVFAKRVLRYPALAAALGRDPDPNHRRVTFLGNHDVTRLRTESPDLQAVKDALTFQLTTRGIPMLYSGDEIGMEGGHDPDNRRDFPGGWPGDARNAFEPAGRTENEAEVFEHVRKLLQLRAKTPALRRGSLTHLAAGPDHYVYARRISGAVVVIAFGRPREFDISDLKLGPMPAARDALGSTGTATLAGSSMSVSGPGVYVFGPARQ
jgi:glycosidase